MCHHIYVNILWALIIVNHRQIHRDITWLLVAHDLWSFHIPYQPKRATTYATSLANQPKQPWQITGDSTPNTSGGLGCGSKVRLFEASNLARMPCVSRWDGETWRNGIKKVHSIFICVHLSISDIQWEQPHFLKRIWEPCSHPKVQYAATLLLLSIVISSQFRDSVGWGGHWNGQTVTLVKLNPASCYQWDLPRSYAGCFQPSRYRSCQHLHPHVQSG